ncbi:MAG: transglutaminase family protein [Phototrophicaceae bacterium]
MYYAISHLTLYKYSHPISDSVMEIRMQPRSDGNQRVIRFDVNVSPDTRIFSTRDYLGNTIHNFNIPALHESLAIKAEAVVELKEPAPLPDALPLSAWDAIDARSHDRDLYDLLLAGQYTQSTPLLKQFEQEVQWQRSNDPLSLVKELNTTIYNAFSYQSGVTRADSPIDVALQSRSGVCQDFTHIMLTMLRNVGIPARYVSGYLFHRVEENDRSDEDASHAWLEAWLPELGWVGFDPTNNLIVGDRHIRVNVSNDYAAASPSRGIFTGDASTELEVRVKVSQLQELPYEHVELTPDMPMPRYSYYQAPQQTQQQQQQQQ